MATVASLNWSWKSAFTTSYNILSYSPRRSVTTSQCTSCGVHQWTKPRTVMSSYSFQFGSGRANRRQNRLLLVTNALLAVEGDPHCFNPQTVEDAAEQAKTAVEKALEDGKQMQQLELLLPVNQRQFNYLDTEPRDYPCGVKQEFEACCKMVTAIFQRMESAGHSVESRRIGEVDNEMDPVGLIYPSNKTVAAVVFPIAETLKQVKSLAKSDPNRPLLLVNPQWRAFGQVVSDFGIGPWKRQAEEFLQKAERTYCLLEQRIGEASNVIAASGGVVRLLKCYPYDWHVYLMAWDGTSELIGKFPEQPTYNELERLVTEARKTIPWQAAPRMLGGSEPAPPPLPKSLSGPFTDEEIDAMDAAVVRRSLIALGQPTSGRVATLRQRLKETQSRE